MFIDFIIQLISGLICKKHRCVKIATRISGHKFSFPFHYLVYCRDGSASIRSHREVFRDIIAFSLSKVGAMITNIFEETRETMSQFECKKG